CCKCCILRLPFGTITATLIALCGLVIAVTSLMQSTVISDRIFFELFNDLKVTYVILTIAIGVIIFMNLMIGFATTGRHSNPGKLRRCCCNPGSASTCVIKTVFVINYILYHLLLFCSLILVVSLFVCYVSSSLCHEESKFPEAEQEIDLTQFHFFLSVRQNETELLKFNGKRLKMLCTDFMSSLSLYVMLSTLGCVLLTVAFMNYLINLSVNWVRLSTKQKCAELMYINSAEMTAFGDGNVDNGSRY
ncbi:hypothetical protein B4U80_03176, partial [Leptotrombidium deliense]